MRDADSMAVLAWPVPRRPAWCGFWRTPGPCGTVWRKLWPLCPFRGPLPVPLPGGLLSAAGSGVRGAGRPLLAGLMEPLFRVPVLAVLRWCWGWWGATPSAPRRQQTSTGKIWSPGRRRSGCWPSATTPSGVPHQCAGRGGVRQCAGRGVAVADPCALRPSDGTGVPGQRKIRCPAGADKASSFSGCQLCGGLHRAVRSSLAGILSVCAFVVFFYVLAQPLTAVGAAWGRSWWRRWSSSP
mgnify:CR=1 FL=1